MRGEKIGFDVYTDVQDKGIFLNDFMKKNNFKFEECAYLGNDINDLPAFKFVKYRIAVKDSFQEIINASTHILSKKGGEGAVREACEFVMGINKEILYLKDSI